VGTRLDGLTAEDAAVIAGSAIRDAHNAIAAAAAADLVDMLGLSTDDALVVAWRMAPNLLTVAIASMMAAADAGFMLAEHRKARAMPALETAPLERVDGRDLVLPDDPDA
jgi:hypothetical protein